MAVTNSIPASSSALSGAHLGTAAGVRPSPGAAASISRQALASLRALIRPTLLRPRTGALRHPNTIAVAVAGYAPLSVTNDLRDIKPPVEIPSGWEWVWWTLGVLAVAALAFFAWRFWQKRRSALPIVPVIPPHARARQKLKEALALINQPRPFCILVSDTIRLYLEERFEFRAPERTTEEFLYELQATNLLTQDQKRSLGEFLQSCDLVKFARYEPGEPELQDLHDSALRLVDETEPALLALHAAQASSPAK